MRLTQKAQVTLFGACVASLIFAGTGYAQAKSVEAKYEEQSKQIDLYKDELNDMQGQLQEYTKYKAMYEYGDLTATGVRAQVNHTIAVDPKIIPYGSEIMIDGQIYVAEDCGGAVKNNVIDVWVEHQSNSFGVKYKEIYIKREK